MSSVKCKSILPTETKNYTETCNTETKFEVNKPVHSKDNVSVNQQPVSLNHISVSQQPASLNQIPASLNQLPGSQKVLISLSKIPLSNYQLSDYTNTKKDNDSVSIMDQE